MWCELFKGPRLKVDVGGIVPIHNCPRYDTIAGQRVDAILGRRQCDSGGPTVGAGQILYT